MTQRESSLVASAANPIRKVVNLLKNMQKKVEAEGAEAEKLYHKFMCYCKTAGDDLQAGMAAADAKGPQVASSIEEAEKQDAQLKGNLKQAQVDRSDAKAALAQAAALREKEAAAYSDNKAMLNTNIAAIKKAVTALEKGVLGFLQTATAQAVRRLALDSEKLDPQDRKDLLSFLSGTTGSDEEAPSTGEVIGILKQMHESMTKSLADSTGAEESAVTSYEDLAQAKNKQVDVLTASIETMMGQIGELGISIVQMKNDLEDSQSGLAEDKKFLADMQKSCSTKTAEFQEQEKVRGEEVAAIAETIKILNSDDALELFKKTLPSSSSFVQVKVSTAALKTSALGMLRGFRRSPQLDLISLALRGRTFGFEKVTGMIDDMVQTLKKEQHDDNHKKEYCAKQFDFAEDKQKMHERAISDEEAAISAAEESIASTKEAISVLEDGLKALDKQVQEAAEQRREEAAAYQELIASDAAAKDLLGFAKNRLQKFYNPALYKPPDSDEPAFVQIRAHTQRRDAPPPPPEAPGAYKKNSDDSGGVIAMIDLLVEDLDKEMATAKVEEENAVDNYNTFTQDAKAKQAQDSRALVDKQSIAADLVADLDKHKEAKLATGKELMGVAGYIQSLHGECDFLLKYFDVRKTARNEEIDGLEKAKAVLNGADYSLVQTQRARFLSSK